MRKSIYLIIGTCIAIAAAMIPFPANAIDKQAPDPAEFGSAGSYVRLALSNRSNTGKITQIKVPIYIKAPAPPDVSPDLDKASVQANVQLYRFQPFSSYIGGTSTYRNHAVWFNDESVGSYNGGAGQCSRNGAPVTLQAGNFRWVPEYGLWRTTVYAILREDTCTSTAGQANNAQIDFSMRITSFTYTQEGFAPVTVSGNAVNGGLVSAGGNAWISYAVPDQSSPNADSYYFSTTARRLSGSNTANYRLAMASPCNLATGTPGDIELFDLDDGEPDNGNQSVGVTAWRTDVSPAQRVTLTTLPGSGKKGGERYIVRMTFQPGARYELRINGIYHINVLQYRLPFENISTVTGCPPSQLWPTLKTSLGPVTSVQEGTPFTATFGLNSTSHTNIDASTFARIWYENNGNGVFDAGDTSVYTRDRDNPTWDTAIGYGDTAVGTSTPLTVDGNLGSRICVSWNLRSTPTTGITIVEPRLLTQCFTITRMPSYVHIWGNDLRVGSAFAGGSPNLNSNVAGFVTPEGASWVEYAVTAPGDPAAPSSVTNFASQSGAANGSSDPQASWSKLTFANRSSFGNFTPQLATLGSIPNVRAAVQTARDGGVPINTNVTGNFAVSSIPNVNNFTGSRSITATGTITIDQNIEYSNGPYANAGQIPQLVLIGTDINIAPNVTRIDAWLVASGTVNTCSTSDTRASVCNQQLRVNGPIMASQLNLRRTYRSPTQPDQVAETINLRGDAYIWANRVSRGSGTWRTVHTTELPPRY